MREKEYWKWCKKRKGNWENCSINKMVKLKQYNLNMCSQARWLSWICNKIWKFVHTFDFSNDHFFMTSNHVFSFLQRTFNICNWDRWMHLLFRCTNNWRCLLSYYSCYLTFPTLLFMLIYISHIVIHLNSSDYSML